MYLLSHWFLFIFNKKCKEFSFIQKLKFRILQWPPSHKMTCPSAPNKIVKKNKSYKDIQFFAEPYRHFSFSTMQQTTFKKATALHPNDKMKYIMCQWIREVVLSFHRTEEKQRLGRGTSNRPCSIRAPSITVVMVTLLLQTSETMGWWPWTGLLPIFLYLMTNQNAALPPHTIPEHS